ncbi:hypothetical protein J132_03469 [Termitomyces sp. J132]|nr:hypothetical protein J132_03469 [Termitomyces sp. J132]
MSHLSPASLLLGTFLFFHLWSFDRFKCLRWNRKSGAFKRIMTYSYLLTIPLIASYPIGLSAIKYYEGFVALPVYGIIPKPIELWRPLSRRFNLPLTLCLSVGWSLEMVTHLEELCFWLFLINAGSSQQSWFHSFYFKTWVVGSIVAVTYMPVITALTHSDPLKSEAYTFLAGSLGSLSLTLWFTPILLMFPSFLRNLRKEGVDTNTIVRLTKFSELNMIRIFFRFLFTVPLLILGIDGARPHHHINESMFWTDLLVMVAGFGCAISSAITLVIFFPRSVEGEIAARDERKRSRSGHTDAYDASLCESPNDFTRTKITRHSTHTFNYGTPVLNSKLLLISSPKTNVQAGMDDLSDQNHSSAVRVMCEPVRTGSIDKCWADEEQDALASLPPLRPNRKKGDDIELATIHQMTESNVAKLNIRTSNVNRMVHNFTSPIDLAYNGQQSGRTWLSFNKS